MTDGLAAVALAPVTAAICLVFSISGDDTLEGKRRKGFSDPWHLAFVGFGVWIVAAGSAAYPLHKENRAGNLGLAIAAVIIGASFFGLLGERRFESWRSRFAFGGPFVMGVIGAVVILLTPP